MLGLSPIILECYLKPGIDDMGSILDKFLLTGPAFPVGRVGEHEIKALTCKLIRGKG